MPNTSLGGPSLPDPNSFYNADWTPPYVHFFGAHGPPMYNSFDYTNPCTPGSDGGIQTLDYDGNTMPKPRSLHLTIHGSSNTASSTVKFQWVPPKDPVTGLPDLPDFPAPPLFVLERVDGRVQTTLWSTTDGVTASGSFTDGLGGLPLTISGVPATTGLLTRRGILNPSGSPAVMLMAPQIKVDATSTGAGGAQGGGEILQYAFPITLSAPNPLTNPLLGDGTNQYVYDNVVPNTVGDQGHLFVDGRVLVAGAGTDDLNSLLLPSSKVECAFDSGLTQISWMVNPAGHQWVVSSTAGSSLQVQTSNATDARIQATFPYNDFVFFQLPAYNANMGNHTETPMVSGSPSEIAHIQTFFLGRASNYPGAYSDYVNSNANTSLRFRTPNWYYYYNQPYKATGSYTPITVQWRGSYCDPYTTGHEIYIKDDAFASGATHVFSVDNTDPHSLVKYAGRLGISGIFQFIDVCAHEKGHQDAWKPQPAPDTVINTLSTVNDMNHDGIDDSWEADHHFRTDRMDTTGAYTVNELGGDRANQEVIADIPALGAILANKALWALDWAGEGRLADGTDSIGGVQWLRPAKAIRPGDTKSDYYFLFYPVTGGTPDTGFIVSSTGYPVWNLSDIQAIVSSPGNVGGTVLTSLP